MVQMGDKESQTFHAQIFWRASLCAQHTLTWIFGNIGSPADALPADSSTAASRAFTWAVKKEVMHFLTWLLWRLLADHHHQWWCAYRDLQSTSEYLEEVCTLARFAQPQTVAVRQQRTARAGRAAGIPTEDLKCSRHTTPTPSSDSGWSRRPCQNQGQKGWPFLILDALSQPVWDAYAAFHLVVTHTLHPHLIVAVPHPQHTLLTRLHVIKASRACNQLPAKETSFFF